jgi:hypothetical protein
VVDKRETTQGIRNGFKLWRFDVANKKWEVKVDLKSSAPQRV